MSPARKKPPEPPEFPLTLRNLRLALAGRLGRPYTQKDAAKRAKISQSHLANVEQGKMPASQFLLFRISTAYEVDLAVVREAYAGSGARLDRDDRTVKRKSNKSSHPRK